MATPEHQRWSEERSRASSRRGSPSAASMNGPPTARSWLIAASACASRLMRHGRPQYWAEELGVVFIVRRPGPRRNEAEIRDRVRALYRQQRFKRFPSERWLREHGPRALAEQIKQTGGARHCACELGVPGPQPARWTDELIEAELRLLCLGRTFWPTKAEFADAGLSGLLPAVRRGHGSAWWARHLGLRQRQRSRHVAAHDAPLDRGHTTLTDIAATQPSMKRPRHAS
jgi:hypothetical protein